MWESLVTFREHLISDLRTFGNREPLSLIPRGTRMTVHRHHPTKVGIPSQSTPSIIHWMSSPDAVNVMEVAALA